MNWFEKIIKNNWRKIIAGVILCCVALVLVLNHESKENSDITFSTKKNTISLTINGEVRSPGTYEVPFGSTLMDNTHRFGGFTMYANLVKIDPYTPLTKDTVISIKTKSKTDDRNYDQLYVMPE